MRQTVRQALQRTLRPAKPSLSGISYAVPHCGQLMIIVKAKTTFRQRRRYDFYREKWSK